MRFVVGLSVCFLTSRIVFFCCLRISRKEKKEKHNHSETSTLQGGGFPGTDPWACRSFSRVKGGINGGSLSIVYIPKIPHIIKPCHRKHQVPVLHDMGTISGPEHQPGYREGKIMGVEYHLDIIRVPDSL